MSDPLAGYQAVESREPVRFLVFSASLRTASLNSQLAKLTAKIIEQQGGIVDLVEMADIEVPSYDQDAQDAEGFPPGAEVFHQHLTANDAFVIASPEYNASMPGVLKNAIDWVSRYRPQPFNERHGLLLRRRRQWSVETAGCGRCASPWSTLAHASSRICSRSLKLTRPLTRWAISLTHS